MHKISVGEAIAAGFRLIGREPLAFGAWCVVVFVLYGLPQLLVWSSFGPAFAAAATDADAEAAQASLLQSQAAMMRYQPLSYLGLLALLLVLPGAIFRAVLRPEERSFLFLKVGAAELWSWLIVLMITLVWLVGLVILLIPILATVGIAASQEDGNLVAGVASLFLLPAFLLSAWPVLRVSMAPVMAFADRTFRFPESWRLTKGHAWRMFLVALVLTVIVTLLQILVLGTGFGILAGSGVFSQANPMLALQGLGMPALLAGVAAWSVLTALGYVLWMAAWANMYRQLRPPLGDTFA